MLTCAGNDRSQVEPVRRTAAGVVLCESGRTPLDEPGRSDAVTPSSMGEADTELGESLPQVALCVRTSLPSRLQDLVSSKGPSLLHETAGEVQGLGGRQWFLGNRFDADSPVGQRTTKSITRPLLTRATGSVAIATPALAAGHSRIRAVRARASSKVIGPW